MTDAAPDPFAILPTAHVLLAYIEELKVDFCLRRGVTPNALLLGRSDYATLQRAAVAVATRPVVASDLAKPETVAGLRVVRTEDEVCCAAALVRWEWP